MTRPIAHRWRLLRRRWWYAVIAAVVGIAGAGCSGSSGAGQAQPGSSQPASTQVSSSRPVSTQVSIAPGDGAVVRVDARTGRQVWRAPVPMASVSAPVTGRGLVVVVGTRDCEDQHLSVVAVDAKTGQPAWQRSVAAEYPCSYGSELRLAGDVVVAGGPDPDVIRPGNTCDNPVAARFPATGLDLATGRPRWHAPTTAGAVIAASAGIVIAAGTSPGCLVGLDPATGKIRWTVAPPVMPFGLGIAGNIAAGNGPHGRSEVAIGLDAGTGKTRWKTALPSSGEGAYPLAVGDAAVVATFEQGSDVTFTGLATATGRRLWQDSVQAHQTWTTIGPRIVVITRFKDLDRATIEARDPRTGVRRWQSGDIGGIGLPVTDGATIVTYSPRNARGFDAADGHQLWTVPGSYQGAAATSDGAYLAQPKPPKNQPQGD